VRSRQRANTGDFECVDLLGTALVVSRDATGALHVLSRVCRHRGMPVAEGRGNRKDFSCPYHLWRYSLERPLSVRTCDGAFGGVRRVEMQSDGALRMKSGAWLFANLSGTAGAARGIARKV